MSELRDFCESVDLTERQERIYDLVCKLEDGWNSLPIAELKDLLVEEFTGARIV